MPEIPTAVQTFPTKELFVSTLVKDIPLGRAILDLVDNCVDGATRLRPDGNFGGLWVRISVKPNQFEIRDNCGGIPLELAVDHAFRFGRPSGMKETPHSVGQFGVGMKRAFFKLGNVFDVDSKSEHSQFRMHVDVNAWKVQKDEKGNDDWHFPLLEAQYAELSVDQTGTTIVLNELHAAVSSEFGLSNFESRLYAELRTAHQHSIQTGLKVFLNDHEVLSKALMLLSSKAIQPAFITLSINGGARSPVKVKIYAGITGEERTEFSAAGWYIFCNNRLVLEADHSRVTGWEEVQFHPRFNRFRGYTFFDCDDSSRLPWNTTKTGVDTESPVYQAVRLRMVAVMQPVLTFLNGVARETGSDDPERPLYSAITRSKMVDISQLPANKQFLAPEAGPRRRARSPNVWIRYQKPKDQFERVKDALKATTQGEVGEKTFDYFYRHECMD